MHPALRDARPVPYWLDRADLRPDPAPELAGEVRCDLAVVGGGYTGLWTALLAKEEDPAREVVLVEARTCGWAASGRNGGFCESSLTHGFGNGMARWPEEMPELLRLGRENLDAIEAALARHGVDCHFERTGQIVVATEPWQLAGLEEEVEQAKGLGQDVTFLDAEAVRAEVDSPTYLGGAYWRGDTALLDPARLAWGLRAACERLGVRIFEGSPVRSLDAEGDGVRLRTDHGSVRAGRAVLGTNAFPPLLRRLRRYTVPVYDYALMTEPLTGEQRAAIGWAGRQGLSDAGNQFHYYRLTPDWRILWGGYDAIYHYGSRIRPEYDQRPQTFDTLARHFFATFPQLEEVRFTHRWGGVIDTCSRFCAFFGTALGGRVAYALGFTGLGVGATHFAAQVMLDLLAGRDTERTRPRMVREKPLPFPPEPLRYAGIQLTRWAIARADARGGRRNLWLRALDRLGLGFDS